MCVSEPRLQRCGTGCSFTLKCLFGLSSVHPILQHITHHLEMLFYCLSVFYLQYCAHCQKSERMNFLAKACTSFSAAYGHLMLLPLWMSIWPPGPLVAAGWQVQGHARCRGRGSWGAGGSNLKRTRIRASFEGCGLPTGVACCVSAGSMPCATDKWV